MMELTINGQAVYVGSGGRAFDKALPSVVFLHGSGLDHRGWALQTRWFAYNGFNVLAPDMPEHSLSGGDALASIEQSGVWLLELLDLAGVQSAHIVGHSQGFLTALELASHHPNRVQSLTGIATAAAIPVNQMLIDSALKSTERAADMMLQWGFGQKIHLGQSPIPGMQPIGAGRRIMANNPLAADLQACANYQGGEQAVAVIAKAQLPCAMILASHDKMTPLKAGKAVASALSAHTTVLPNHGHMLPMEAPAQVLNVLRDFIAQVD